MARDTEESSTTSRTLWITWWTTLESPTDTFVVVAMSDEIGATSEVQQSTQIGVRVTIIQLVMTREPKKPTDLEGVVEPATSVELCTSWTCAGTGRAIGGIPAEGSRSGARGDRLGLCLRLELEDVTEGLGGLGLDSGRDALDVEVQQIRGELWDHPC